MFPAATGSSPAAGKYQGYPLPGRDPAWQLPTLMPGMSVNWTPGRPRCQPPANPAHPRPQWGKNATMRQAGAKVTATPPVAE
jgi:hypothetical protein